MLENNLKEIIKRHDKEIEEFQDSCTHSEISNWMPHMLVPGHFSHDARICKRCEKILESRGLPDGKSADNK